MKKTILIIVAHPDDETISMAGTIRNHINNGDKVFAISMTDGVSARNNSKDREIIDRKKFAIKASEIIGFKWLKFFSFDDNCLDKYNLLEIVKTIEKIKIQIDPNIVYTHSSADLNIDHLILHKAVLTAFRPLPNEKCEEIRLFEIASSTEYGTQTKIGNFTPNLFISIKEYWSYKKEALNAYKKELRKNPHPRSISQIKNLAKFRGSQVGEEMTEAFEVVRKIIR